MAMAMKDVGIDPGCLKDNDNFSSRPSILTELIGPVPVHRLPL